MKSSLGNVSGSSKLLGISIDGLKAMLDVLLTKSLATLEINGFRKAEVPLHPDLRAYQVKLHNEVISQLD